MDITIDDYVIPQAIMEPMSMHLFRMGLFPNLMGFRHIVETVARIVQTDPQHWNIGEVYATIGKRYKKSGSAVEKAIRSTIHNCINSKSIYYLNELFGFDIYNKEKGITANEFITLFAGKIMFELSN